MVSNFWVMEILAQAGGTPAGTTAVVANAGNEALLIWVFALFGVAVAIAALEIFIPSGGVLGAAAFLCSVAAIVVAFKISTGYGAAATGFAVMATPATIWMGIKVFPNTPMGRRIILSAGSTPDEMQIAEIEKREELRAISSLVGARGRTMTALRPGGTMRLEGEDVEAFAETGMIEADVEVEIVSIADRQLRVRAV